MENINETLENLRKYSCIYANIIQTILENKDKLTFVYNSSVSGSGSILLGKLFELFGKERVEKELEEFLSFNFFSRFGGGIGMTRLARAYELLKQEQLQEI